MEEGEREEREREKERVSERERLNADPGRVESDDIVLQMHKVAIRQFLTQVLAEPVTILRYEIQRGRTRRN